MQEKIDAAKEAIDAIFGDTTVSQSETKEALEDVQDHLESCLAALEDDEG